MGEIMKKSILLSFYLLFTCGISACSNLSDDTAAGFTGDEQVIDATVAPSDKCGVDGISCNDTALINYTKTEADYKAYGERTPKDQLYTQAAVGSNLTATVPPAIEEEDIVKPVEIVCTENCDNEDFAELRDSILNSNPDSNSGDNSDDSVVTSEFTEDSFDIANYIKSNGDDENIDFIEVGKKNTVEENIDLDVEVKVTDDTVLTWDAKEGDNLRELLMQWSTKAGWKLLWNTNRNYTLSAGVMFKGKFADVSSALIRAFARARPAPIATYYKGNRVIVVETMENENAY